MPYNLPTPETLIPDLLRAPPQTRAVLDRYGLRGCGGPLGPMESLDFFARATMSRSLASSKNSARHSVGKNSAWKLPARAMAHPPLNPTPGRMS